MVRKKSILWTALILGVSQLALAQTPTDWPNYSQSSQQAVALTSSMTNFANNMALAGANVYLQQQTNAFLSLTTQFQTFVASGEPYATAIAQFQTLKNNYLAYRSIIQNQGAALPYALLDEWYGVAFNQMTLDAGLNQPIPAAPPHAR